MQQEATYELGSNNLSCALGRLILFQYIGKGRLGIGNEH